MKPIFTALDFPSWEISSAFLDEHGLTGVPVKVGMELFYREGTKVIEQLKERGHPVFLDLKLHDIPTTVKRAMQNLAALEVDIVNVHASGGREMMAQAKEGLLQGAHREHETKLIAVTILTSMDEATIAQDLHMQGTVQENAVRLAGLANESGIDGVVCSVHEAAAIKEECGTSFLTVTPGIRLADKTIHDQRRIATPGAARKLGADVLVVGRSITQAMDPQKAYKQVWEEWENGSSK